jgi:hypothetical protein
MVPIKSRLAMIAVGAALALPVYSAPSLAASCYDLWYERNQIYDDNGYCFKTQLGRDTFDNSDCHTDNAQLSRAEQRRVDRIKAEERRKRCKVNN